ncbi:V-set domain-containing T-cell activation inhibitor 1 Precursor [Larimichthys crocea]|uniref:V-set domain-containing T-cell activation inhibitor 1 n=1 Tax=Larimichthys crocea TaxID=215358 RepID=A0A6G0HJQ1_LARCR|nr:V-set domain-containing T-cell activation inhibitor 1 Precursor [Larimichthys crocea]
MVHQRRSGPLLAGMLFFFAVSTSMTTMIFQRWNGPRKACSLIVFLYRDGCETYEMKNPAFEYRTSFITKELQNGIISLRISNVQLSDAGKYQCKKLWKNAPRDITTVQLLVVAVSQPKLSVILAKSGGVNLQCEASCWLPEPEITFLDDREKEIPADDPRRHQETSGCYTVTRKVTLQDATNSVTCRVHQPKTNQTRNTEILIPVDCMRSCFLPTAITTGVTVLLLLPTCALVVFVWMKYRKPGADLKSQLREKEEIIRQLQNIRSQLSPTVSHHDQPTFTDSHAASVHYTSRRNQSCTVNNTEPSSSSSANAAKKTSGYIGRSKSMSHSLRPVDHKLQHRRSLVLPSSVVPRLQRNSKEESEHLMS